MTKTTTIQFSATWTSFRQFKITHHLQTTYTDLNRSQRLCSYLTYNKYCCAHRTTTIIFNCNFENNYYYTITFIRDFENNYYYTIILICNFENNYYYTIIFTCNFENNYYYTINFICDFENNYYYTIIFTCNFKNRYYYSIIFICNSENTGPLFSYAVLKKIITPLSSFVISEKQNYYIRVKGRKEI